MGATGAKSAAKDVGQAARADLKRLANREQKEQTEIDSGTLDLGFRYTPFTFRNMPFPSSATPHLSTCPGSCVAGSIA